MIGVHSLTRIDMAQPVIQTSFHGGEFAPTLFARVDLAKYHHGLALAENYYVDYRGGVSTRMGLEYIIQAKDSTQPVRMIPFSASFGDTYMLEVGHLYMRFIKNGAMVLEVPKTITGITQANPGVVTSNTHGFGNGDVVFLGDVVGMVQVNGRYFKVANVAANTFELQDLNGVNVNTTGYTAYSSAGTASRVYTISTPWQGSDLAMLKFAQNINKMVFVHSGYPPSELIFNAPTNWTLTTILFGSTAAQPTISGITTTSVGAASSISYKVTSVDVNNQESLPSAAFGITFNNFVTTTFTVSWTAVAGAVYYNVYRATFISSGAGVPAGQAYGFVGFADGTSFVETGGQIDVNYEITPPVFDNPFGGSPIDSLTLGTNDTYALVPTITIAAPSSGIQATGSVSLSLATAAVSSSTGGHAVGEYFYGPGGSVVRAATIAGGGTVSSVTISAGGSFTSGTAPTASVTYVGGDTGTTISLNITWHIGALTIVNAGTGYTSAPAVTFSAGAATATTTVGSVFAGNPSVVTFFDQRMVLAGSTLQPQTFHMSQPGSYYNLNVSIPTQPDDAITGTLVSGQLNTIRSMIPMPSGLIILTARQAWLVNGGSAGAPVTAIEIVANAQAYNGASDVPPIVANDHVLYVQAKGTIVRDLAFNFYTNVFTGTDISVLSSHLFYGYSISEWAWAEEPFKVVWAVRSDGALLSLTYVKEQEMVGWCHSITDGSFKSIATITENTLQGYVDAIYTVVERTVNGNTIKYIERMVERFFPAGVEDAFCVDAGIQYSGSPATSFRGAEHLAGETVTGLADGVPITPFVMPTSGFFTLASPASKIVVGLAYTPLFQTLRLDTGEPTIQSKRKKIVGITVRCAETLGLQIGRTFDTLVPMKAFAGTELVTGDGRTIIDQAFTEEGQFCIEQPNPFPATILGVIPETAVGDTK